MKKILLGLLSSLALCFPALAAGVPSDVTVRQILLGQLQSNNRAYITNINNGSSMLVQITGCKESWDTGEKFLLVRGRKGNFFLIRSARFFHYYNQNGNDWDRAVQSIIADNALCSVHDG